MNINWFDCVIKKKVVDVQRKEKMYIYMFKIVFFLLLWVKNFFGNIIFFGFKNYINGNWKFIF